MRNYRNMPFVMAHLFLLYCVGAMVAGSSLALARKQIYWACGLLASVVVVQSAVQSAGTIEQLLAGAEFDAELATTVEGYLIPRE